MRSDLQHLICRRRQRSFHTKLPLAAIAAAALLLVAPRAQGLTVEMGFEDVPGGIQTFDETNLGCGAPGTLGELSCIGENLSGTGGGWTVNSWDLFVDPDPTVSNSIVVTNNTGFTQTFLFAVTLPVSVTFGPPSFIKGSIGGAATDKNGDGVTLATSGGLSLYRALINGSVVRTMLNDPFSTSNPNAYGSVTIPALVDFGIPNAESVAVATTTDIGLTLRFTLSPFDSAGITSVFNVEPIPEPTTAIMLLAGLTGLARMGRPRR